MTVGIVVVVVTRDPGDVDGVGTRGCAESEVPEHPATTSAGTGATAGGAVGGAGGRAEGVGAAPGAGAGAEWGAGRRSEGEVQRFLGAQQQLSNAINEHLGFRGYMLMMRLQRACNLRDLHDLLPDFARAMTPAGER